jgi:xylulokinase
MGERPIEPVVLAIDLGTGGPKVAVVSTSGAVEAWAHRPVTTTFLEHGGAEQDPHEIWAALVAATHEALAVWAGDHRRFVAVAVTSQYMSTIPVAADGRAVGPCILWMDTRGGGDNLGLLTSTTFPLWVERHGLVPLPSGTDGLAHIAVLRRHHPEALAAAAHVVEPMDFVTARLTGRVCATQSSAFSLLTVDNRTWGTTRYDDDLVAAAGVDPALLPPLVPLRGVIGDVRPAVAAELGIPAGLPVVPGTIDSITSAVGTGALRPEQGGVVIGTTSILVTHLREHRGDLGSALFTVPSPVPGSWFVGAENGLGGRALDWFIRTVLDPDDDLVADRHGPLADPHAVIERAAARIAPGSDGVLVAPWLLGSIAPAPDDEVRGAITGLDIRHTRAHLARAVLEGVALNLAWLVPAVERFVGGGFDVIRFGGGGAQSDLWAQILADAVGRPIEQLASPRTTNARGAAFLALADLGLLDLDDVPSLVQVRAVRDPDPAAVPVMQDALARLVALHPALAAQAQTPARPDTP